MYEFISHNSEKKSQNCKFVSGNYEKKKSELWEKKPQLPFLIFYSVAEMGFHNIDIFKSDLSGQMLYYYC